MKLVNLANLGNPSFSRLEEEQLEEEVYSRQRGEVALNSYDAFHFFSLCHKNNT